MSGEIDSPTDIPGQTQFLVPPEECWYLVWAQETKVLAGGEFFGYRSTSLLKWGNVRYSHAASYVALLLADRICSHGCI
jgi:hypothetical protein